MSDFHYVRTLGSDGGVDACSGPAIGLDLESVLADGLPPYKVALQMIAGLCEILDIAHEDGEVHGDLDPKHVFIDDTGAISVEAFGQSRSRAPEGRPKGAVTDLYGLGFVAFRLLAFQRLPTLSRDDPNDHDDTVIDSILQIRFEGLNEEMVGDVQWFLAKLLSFEREDRPTAVETWRTFLAYAEEARGPDFVEWCLDALDSGGERRAVLENAEPTEAPDGLKGPLVSVGPLSAGGIAFGAGAAVAGGTAFFTKDEMKAALEQSNRSSEEQFRPAPGGGSATNFWSRDQLAAMADEPDQAPRPKRATGEGEKRKTMALSKGDFEKKSRPPPPVASQTAVAAADPPPGPLPVSLDNHPFESNSFDQPEPTVRMNSKAVRTLTPAPAPQVFRPPGAGGVMPEPAPGRPQRNHSVPAAPPPPPAHDPHPPIHSSEGQYGGEATVVQSQGEVQAALAQERARVHASLQPQPSPIASFDQARPAQQAEESNLNIWLGAMILLALVIAMVVCAGLGGLSTFAALMSNTGGDTVPVTAPVPPPSLPTKPDPKDGVATVDSPKPETKPEPKPTKPEPKTTRPRPRPRPRPTPRPTRPTPTPAPVPAPQPVPEPEPVVNTGPVTLTLRTADRGKLSCPGVATKPFDGNTSMNIENYALPATCLVIIDGARESFQVFGTGMVKCNKRGDKVKCSSRAVGK